MNTATQDPVPSDVGMLPSRTDPAAGNGATPPLLDTLVRSAHDTVDRVAAKAAPVVERLISSAHGASEAVQQRARDVGDLSHEWTDTLRATVRDHPLASLAVALAVGVLVSRIAQGDGR